MLKKRVQLPSDVRREQIVQAALNIFARKGFDAATNKEIAKEAGIASPGLIYHHFQDKASLLRAVIEMHTGGNMPHPAPEVIMKMSVEDGLRHLLRHFLNDIGQPAFVSFVRVLLGEAMRRPEFAKILSEVMVKTMFTTLTGFFQYHIEQGSIRPIDPVVTTMRFVGSTLSVLMLREVLEIPAVRALDPAAMEQQMVDDFLRGILP